MSATFTPDQSAEIDTRIGEMIATVIGVGQYTDRWTSIAQTRAAGPDYNSIWGSVSRGADAQRPRARTDRSLHAPAPTVFVIGDRSPICVDLPRDEKTPAPVRGPASPSPDTLRAPSWSAGALLFVAGGLLLSSLVRSRHSLSCGGETSHDSAAAGSRQSSRTSLEA